MAEWHLTQEEWIAFRNENREEHRRLFQVINGQNGRLRKIEVWRGEVKGMVKVAAGGGRWAGSAGIVLMGAIVGSVVTAVTTVWLMLRWLG